MKKGLGRFVFCGIRDIVSELQQILPDLETDENGKLSADDIITDRLTNTHLKPLSALGDEFCRNISYIDELNQHRVFIDAIKILSKETSFHNILNIDFFENSNSENIEFFNSLSTGHKFVIHALTSIIAFSGPRSLLIFDEPETHLHPPILAALMQAVRMVLNKKNAFMILATHSPVVLQETLMEHVYFVRREGRFMKVTQPDMQTFGESIGSLTNIAFGLTGEMTDFHNTLDRIVEGLFDFPSTNQTPEKMLEEVEKSFKGGLSIQARAYILSKIYSNK